VLIVIIFAIIGIIILATVLSGQNNSLPQCLEEGIPCSQNNCCNGLTCQPICGMVNGVEDCTTETYCLVG